MSSFSNSIGEINSPFTFAITSILHRLAINYLSLSIFTIIRIIIRFIIISKANKTSTIYSRFSRSFLKKIHTSSLSSIDSSSVVIDNLSYLFLSNTKLLSNQRNRSSSNSKIDDFLNSISIQSEFRFLLIIFNFCKFNIDSFIFISSKATRTSNFLISDRIDNRSMSSRNGN